ncbi:MAG: hypothetical protein QOE55_2581 [Acidobacteriaceae bacterium]|nr:hypothetical protein [Acidobacteriaceae bacterium]
MVPGKSNEPAFARLLGRLESLDGAAGRKNLFHLIHGAYLMYLP